MEKTRRALTSFVFKKYTITEPPMTQTIFIERLAGK